MSKSKVEIRASQNRYEMCCRCEYWYDGQSYYGGYCKKHDKELSPAFICDDFKRYRKKTWWEKVKIWWKTDFWDDRNN